MDAEAHRDEAAAPDPASADESAVPNERRGQGAVERWAALPADQPEDDSVVGQEHLAADPPGAADRGHQLDAGAARSVRRDVPWALDAERPA